MLNLFYHITLKKSSLLENNPELSNVLKAYILLFSMTVFMVYMLSGSDIHSGIVFKLAVLILRACTAKLTVDESAVDELAVYPVRVIGV